MYLLSIVYSFSMTIACSKLQDSHVRIVNTEKRAGAGEREREYRLGTGYHDNATNALS